MSTMADAETIVVSRCHKLLDMRNFTGCAMIVKMNKQLGKDWLELDQAEAICNVIIAAENLLPNGFMDFYGMIRATRLGPAVLDDFMRLMNLLDGRFNGFPSSQEASHYALQAWSMLSKPDIKERYDLAISGPGFLGRGNIYGGSSSVEDHYYGDGGDESCGEESDGKYDGGDGRGGGFGGMDKGKEKVETFTRICPFCMVMDECETRDEELCLSCFKVSKGIHATSKCFPFPPPENAEERHNHRVGLFQLGLPKESSFFPKEHNPNQNVGRGTDNEVVVISDDDDDDDDENQEIMTMARAAKLCIVNGRRVKMIPLKKKTKDSSTSNVKKTATAEA